MAAWKPQGEGVWWILAKQVIPSKRGVCVSCSVMSNCPTSPWTVALQAPLSMEFSGQEHWSGLSFPSPGYLSDPGIKPGSPALQPDSLPSEPPGVGWLRIWHQIGVFIDDTYCGCQQEAP